MVLPRRITTDPADLPSANLRYRPPDPKLADLPFAGCPGDNHASHPAIAGARPGDPVHRICNSERWRIEHVQGETSSRLSRAFAPPDGTTFPRGEVAAILNWPRETGGEDFNHLPRREALEVVPPELAFETRKETGRCRCGSALLHNSDC